MRISGNLIVFSDEHPQEEGVYLWQHSTGVETINVAYYPPKHEYGIRWDEYYGVTEMRGRNVKNLKGSFCRIYMD